MASLMDEHADGLSSEASTDDNIVALDDLEGLVCEDSEVIFRGRRKSRNVVPVIDISMASCSNDPVGEYISQTEPLGPTLEGHSDELEEMILEAGLDEPLFDVTIPSNNGYCDTSMSGDLQVNEAHCFGSAHDLHGELLFDGHVEVNNTFVENLNTSNSSDVNEQVQNDPDSSNHADLTDSSDSEDSLPRGRLAKKRKPIADPKRWNKNETIAKRCKGEEYMGFRRHDRNSTKKIVQDVPRAARVMGPACKSAQCRKWSTRECGKVSEHLRLKLFNEFWNEMNWSEKKLFICSQVITKEPKQRTAKTDKRGNTYFYHLKMGTELIPVCQKMFLNTFGLKNSTIRYWLSSYNQIGEVESSGPEESSDENPNGTEEPEEIAAEDALVVSEEIVTVAPTLQTTRESRQQHLQKFLDEFPKVPSHYCRQSTERLYVQTDIRSKTHLYQLYCEHSRLKAIEPYNRCTFDRECKQKKISIYQPRKDQCDLCFQYKLKNLGKDEYDLHVSREKRAQQEKARDKTLAQSGKIHLITCDVMAVKLLPHIKASISYYKMKLAMHNFSVYNLVTHDAMCYWFSEVDSTLVASTFASCLINYIEELLQNSGDLKDVIIFSDGCTYQNRNAVLSSALLSLSMKRQVFIYQKFLEKGHTYMEVDSVHSTIETAMKDKELFLPSNLVQVTREARRKPFPYRAKLLQHDFFTDYSIKSTMRYESIRPGNTTNDPVVTELRCLQYDPAGFIRFKTNFDGEYELLPRRPKQVTGETKQLNKNPLPIPKDKWTDLISLKPQIPYDCHNFYDSLPHKEESYRGRKKELKKSNND